MLSGGIFLLIRRCIAIELKVPQYFGMPARACTSRDKVISVGVHVHMCNNFLLMTLYRLTHLFKQ